MSVQQCYKNTRKSWNNAVCFEHLTVVYPVQPYIVYGVTFRQYLLLREKKITKNMCNPLSQMCKFLPD